MKESFIILIASESTCFLWDTWHSPGLLVLFELQVISRSGWIKTPMAQSVFFSGKAVSCAQALLQEWGSGKTQRRTQRSSLLHRGTPGVITVVFDRSGPLARPTNLSSGGDHINFTDVVITDTVIIETPIWLLGTQFAGLGDAWDSTCKTSLSLVRPAHSAREEPN
jgi:hypothetical protein